MVTRRLVITGRVQGVGFRYAMRDEAARHGVDGWVRNRRDGSVEALVQGSAEAVTALTEWAREGPPGAEVDALAATEVSDTPKVQGFELKPTL